MGKYCDFMDRLDDLIFEDILAMSDEEVMAEMVEELGSQEAVDKEIEAIQQQMNKIVAAHKAKEK